jgi:hypothetical protein
MMPSIAAETAILSQMRQYLSLVLAAQGSRVSARRDLSVFIFGNCNCPGSLRSIVLFGVLVLLVGDDMENK